MTKIPIILEEYLERTGQLDHWPLSEGHLLEEAEWQLYQCDQEGSSAYEHSRADKAALRRYVNRLKKKGARK